MLGMKIGVFEDEEHDKACFKVLRPLCMPNLGQKLFFGHAPGPLKHGYLAYFQYRQVIGMLGMKI